MGVSSTEFESFEQQFLELIGEFQGLKSSESRLRESVRSESSRAEAAEAGRSSAERAAAEARAGSAAAAAAAAQAVAALAKAQEDAAAIKMQLDLAERQRDRLEERCSELSMQLDTSDRELQTLRSQLASHATLQRQYNELQERIRLATEEARTESSRLEAELRRVERCASGGVEVRERARLAAAAHARERRLANAELQHATRELNTANVELARLSITITELQGRLSEYEFNHSSTKKIITSANDAETLASLRAALEVERAGSARLERALAAAVADNASLTATLRPTHATEADVDTAAPLEPKEELATNITALDEFLAE